MRFENHHVALLVSGSADSVADGTIEAFDPQNMGGNRRNFVPASRKAAIYWGTV